MTMYTLSCKMNNMNFFFLSYFSKELKNLHRIENILVELSKQVAGRVMIERNNYFILYKNKKIINKKNIKNYKL